MLPLARCSTTTTPTWSRGCDPGALEAGRRRSGSLVCDPGSLAQFGGGWLGRSGKAWSPQSAESSTTVGHGGGGAGVRQVTLTMSWSVWGRRELGGCLTLEGRHATVGSSLLWTRRHLGRGGSPHPGETSSPGEGEAVSRLCQPPGDIACRSSCCRGGASAGRGTSPIWRRDSAAARPHAHARRSSRGLQSEPGFDRTGGDLRRRTERGRGGGLVQLQLPRRRHSLVWRSFCQKIFHRQCASCWLWRVLRRCKLLWT